MLPRDIFVEAEVERHVAIVVEVDYECAVVPACEFTRGVEGCGCFPKPAFQHTECNSA
jgi:hypothetical protein